MSTPTDPETHAIKMAKQYDLIRRLVESRPGKPKLALKKHLPTSTKLHSDEVAGVQIARDDNSILDEEVSAPDSDVSPMMRRAMAGVCEPVQLHDSSILTKAERARLEKEREEFRLTHHREAFYSPRMWLAPLSLFASNETLDDLPLGPVIDIEARVLSVV